MAIDFPNTPTNGDTYTVGNRTWTWNGTSWTGNASTAFQPLDGDLTAIAALTGTSGFLTRTATNTWALNTLVNADIPSSLTGKTYNALTLTAATTGFTIAGGTTSKTLTVSNTLTLAGTDTSTLNIGSGGTLGTAAFTASSAYEPAITTLAISKGGTGTGTAPTQWGIIYAASGTAYASTAAGTAGQLLQSNGTSAPTWVTAVSLSANNAFTGANTFTNTTGQTFRATSTSDGIIIDGNGLGSTSLALTLTTAALTTSKTITFPDATGTVVTTGDTGSVTSTMILDGTIVNGDISASASIAVSKLAASTISGVTLGNNLSSLTIGTGLSGTSYNGSSAVTIAIDSTVATLTGSQTLTNKTITSPTINTSIVAGSASMDIFNTTATTVNAFGAATTLAIGASTGTATIANATVTLSNATALNVNGSNPTLASSSTGTLTLFNTNLLTVNAFAAATTLNMGYTGASSATTTIAAATPGSTATNTINIATGLPAAGGTRTVNIATGTQTAGTSNVNIGTGMTSGTGNVTIGSGTTAVSMNGTWTFASSSTFAMTGIASGNWTGSSSLYNAAIAGRNVQMLGSPYSIACASTSSIRYKDSVESFTFDKDKLLSLDTKSFKYKKDIEANGIENAQVHYGLIAEDVDALGGFEWILDYTEEGLPDYIYWGERMPQVLFSISKQLNEENKQMKQQIEELQAENESLSASLSGIISRLDAAGI